MAIARLRTPFILTSSPCARPLVLFLNRKGFKGRGNGLSKAENERLFESVNLDEITTLIFEGLTRKLGKAQGG